MSNHHRIIANLIKQGTIAETDPANGLVRVQHGELQTDWLPYFVPFAGGVFIHHPLSTDENCIILSPNGETANGLALCGLRLVSITVEKQNPPQKQPPKPLL